jgi:hypothetical protein
MPLSQRPKHRARRTSHRAQVSAGLTALATLATVTTVVLIVAESALLPSSALTGKPPRHPTKTTVTATATVTATVTPLPTYPTQTVTATQNVAGPTQTVTTTITVNPTGTPNDAPTTSPTASTSSAPGGRSLLDRTDLIYGSEIGSWDKVGGPAVSPAVSADVTGADVRVIRYAVSDCFANMTCGLDNHTGTIHRADFDTVVHAVQNDGAVLWLKMVPIASDTINGINGSVFCPPWTGDASGNLPMYKAVVAEVRTAGYAGPLVIESNNEMEYACWKFWQSQGAPITGAGSVGVSKRIGEHYAATMPALKTYAETLGFSQVVVGGYIGVGGGPQWGQSCTADATKPFGYACGYQSRWVTEFNTAVHSAYVAAGNDPAYIPDFEAIHSYGHSPDFSSAAGYEFDDNICFAYYRNWLTQTHAVIGSVWGANDVKLSLSEWNAGSSNSSGTWSGWTTAGRPEQFYAGWYQMLRGDGNTGPDGTAYWNSNLFLIAGNSDTGSGRFYNWIHQDGSVPSWYATIRDFMTGVR